MFKQTISSDESALLIARQDDPRSIPDSANTVWRVCEPNSYGSFGASFKKVARSPINASRQNKKATVVGFDATAEYESDVTPINMLEDLQGFLFADARYKDRIAATAATVNGYTVASGGASYRAGDIVYSEGATDGPNNGPRPVLAGSTPTNVRVDGLTARAGQAITLHRVGRVFAAGALAVDASGALPVITGAGLDALGLIPGEFVFVGGDAPELRFAEASNRGWARVLRIDAGALTLDKTDGEWSDDDGAGKTVAIYFGTVVKNESDPTLIRQFNYALRRKLGRPDAASNVVQSEVVIGAVCNELTITIPEEDKLTCNLAYVARDHKTYTDDSVIKGVEVEPAEADAYNSTQDAVRARMAVYPAQRNNSAPIPILGVFTEWKITVNNNVTARKGVKYMGAYSVTPGKFEVMATLTAYFTDVASVEAVRQNKDVTFDFVEYKDNKGMAIDFPMCSLATEGVELAPNDPMMISVDSEMSTGRKYDVGLDHTMLAVVFPYLPDMASSTVE